MAHTHIASNHRPAAEAWRARPSPSRTELGDALTSLLEEHRLISSAIDVLERWAEAADQRQPVPRGALRELVTVLTEFVDHIHHEKEESILMKVLFDSGVAWNSEPMAGLRSEHDQERYLSEALRHLAEQDDEWSEHARLHFVSIARELVAFQRRHIRTETTELYPLVRRQLAPVVQRELAGEFARFDQGIRSERERLLATIARLTSLGAATPVIGDAAVGPVFSVPLHMLVRDATEFAEEHGIHHLPVVSSGALVGVVCTCDLRELEPDLPISCAMHVPAVTIDRSAPYGSAVRLMSEHNVGSVVVTEGEDVLGIVTRNDLLRRRPFATELPGCRCMCCGSLEHLSQDGRGTLCCDCRDSAGPNTSDDELGGGD